MAVNATIISTKGTKNFTGNHDPPPSHPAPRKERKMKCQLCVKEIFKEAKKEFPKTHVSMLQARILEQLGRLPDAVSTSDHGRALCLQHLMDYV